MDGSYVLSGLCVAALVGYFIGQTKNKPIRGAIIGFLLGPLGWLLIAVSPNEHPTCPHCMGNIVAGAKRCKNCGEAIPRCPECNKQLGLRRQDDCKHCGAELADEDWPDERRRGRLS